MTETTSNRFDQLRYMTELERMYCTDRHKFLEQLSIARREDVMDKSDDAINDGLSKRFADECKWKDRFDIDLYNQNGFSGWVDTNDAEDIRHLIKQDEYEAIHSDICWDIVVDAPSDIEIENVRHRVDGDITFTNPSQAFLTYTKGGAS